MIRKEVERLARANDTSGDPLQCGPASRDWTTGLDAASTQWEFLFCPQTQGVLMAWFDRSEGLVRIVVSDWVITGSPGNPNRVAGTFGDEFQRYDLEGGAFQSLVYPSKGLEFIFSRFGTLEAIGVFRPGVR
jgi:hypothetical protein